MNTKFEKLNIAASNEGKLSKINNRAAEELKRIEKKITPDQVAMAKEQYTECIEKEFKDC